MSFKLDPQFEVDSFLVTQLPLCQVRLSDNASFPWIILIPQAEGMVEIIDLNADQQQQLLREINLASRVMKSLYKADKLNVANLGNVVAQLHVHVIARFKADPAFPKPVWNSGERTAYSADALQQEITKIANAFKETQA